MKNNFYFILLVGFFFSSCGVNYKAVPYFTDLTQDSLAVEAIENNIVVKIQPGDLLAITVTSLNQEASAIFNVGNTNTANLNINTPNINNTLNGFLVDENGDIQMPVVGNIHVSGLSTKEARAVVRAKLVDYLKEPVVNLRMANFKVSVLGDVVRPGVYPIQNEKVSVTEALSLAGDLNITAIRNNILLVREVDNQRRYIRLNLNSKDIFKSEYFYLQNNDMIYVQPSNAKYASVDRNYRNVSFALSAISIIVLIISRF